MNNKSISQKVHFFCALLEKTPIAMRMTLLFLFVLVFQLQAEQSYSQTTKISLDMKNSSIEKILQTIEEKSEFYFLYNSKLIDVDRKMDIQAIEESIASVLNQLFEAEDVEYEVKGAQIILHPKEMGRIASNLVSEARQQKKQIFGKVVDERGEPIIGANIIEKNTLNGTVTNIDGDFSLSVNSDAVLNVTYIGYFPEEIATDGKINFEIVLKEDTQMLDEVIVVAFGKMTKEAFTGSAGVVKSDELVKAQVSNPLNTLSGRVAGIQLSNSSSQLGSSPSITIRGFSSISSDTEPLIVVDGMPFDGDLNLINSSDIESMTVLKDAASNALYGARGANGVIMVTTKRGASGDARITVDSKWGYNSNGLKNYKTTDSQQFYETYYNMLYNYYVTEDGGGMMASDAHTEANRHLANPSTGVGQGYMVYSVPSGEEFILQGGLMNPNATMGTLYSYDNQQLWLQADDWEKEGLRNGFRQEYNISVSGAANRINYFTSLGYLNQEGIQEGSAQDRLTARLKLDFNAKEWLRMGGNFNYTRYNYNQISEGTIGTGTIWSTIKTLAPIYPVYYRDSDKNIMIDEWGEEMYDFARSYGLSRAGGGLAAMPSFQINTGTMKRTGAPISRADLLIS